MPRTAHTQAKRISAADAAGMVRSGMRLDFGGALSQPDVFDAALAARAGELTEVSIRICLATSARPFMEADPRGEHFHALSWHFGGYERIKYGAGICHYAPLNLGEVPDYYRRFIDPIDMVVLRTRPLGGDGWFNFGPTNAWLRAITERAKTVVVETTPGLPHAFGPDNGLRESEVDFVIEGAEGPLDQLPNHAPDEIDTAVAHLIAAEVEDGACLQIGIGGMPNAVCSILAKGAAKDLGIHTEMLTDGIAELVASGAVTGARKQLDPGKVVYTFALGSADLYRFIDGNEDLLCCPTDYTNLPHMIMRNDKVVSINSTTQIDLQGQAASESDGHRHLTGTGGQLQFVRGAYASAGGKSFICLPSTYERKGVRKSRIALEHAPGTIVTTPRSDVMYVVTEYGIANLKGRSVAERARLLIGLAHPDFREGLERQAREHGLIARGC